jgi:translation initiation factor IF-3
LLGVENEPLGIVRLGDARRMAEEADVDLVEIAPTAAPPVCRLMDYGKFRYQEQKRQHDARAKQKIIQIKEVKFRPATDDGDYSIKVRNLLRFLEEGDKVKVTLRFRGREMAHQEFGVRLLERVRGDIEGIGVVESMPRLEGRQMIMMVAPKKKEPPKKAVTGAPDGAAPPVAAAGGSGVGVPASAPARADTA